MTRIDEIRARLAACDLPLYTPQHSTDGQRSEHYRKVFVDDHGDGKFVAEFNAFRLEWCDLLIAAPADLAHLLAEVERLTVARANGALELVNAEVAAERAAVVAWLRGNAEIASGGGVADESTREFFDTIADDIERGDHRGTR